LRKSYSGVKAHTQYVTLGEARKNHLLIDWKEAIIQKPGFTGIKAYDDFPACPKSVRISIGYSCFIVWQLRGKFPELLDDPKVGKEARKLF